jgi:hypothetical protein
MLRAAMLCALSLPAWGQNTTVDDLVGEGMFGVNWADGLEAVRAKHPDGERTELDRFVHWTVTDGRSVFDVERRRKNRIQFIFVADRLGAVFLMFPSCNKVVDALTKSLGPFYETAPDPARGKPMKRRRWDGAEATIEVEPLYGDCLVMIGATRERMGSPPPDGPK